MSIASVNPTTGQLLRAFSPHPPDEIERRLARAEAAFRLWRLITVADRARVLVRAAEILDRNKRELGQLMTVEMGKPLRSAIAEAEKCAFACRYYAANGPNFVTPEAIENSDQTVEYHPLGAVLAVMPWNFPFWQVIRFAAPALLAGNVALLKHASNVPQCALALEDLFHQAGAPPGVFQTLLVGPGEVKKLIADPRVAAVTITGSEQAGRAVAAEAGAHLKKAVLELGGSDPFIVLPSADLEKSAQTAVKARVVNNGQSCIAAKRFIACDPVYEVFLERFVHGMRALKVGDPMDDATDVGPLATSAIRDGLEKQVRRSVAAGARLVVGGNRLFNRGWFYEPTVLADIPRSAPAYGEELFGPVASVFRAADRADALLRANDSAFGLGASLWTRDRDDVAIFARDLEVGSLFVNEMVASDPRFPFGGVKNSGHGRELGVWGLREFVNIKTVRRFF